MCLPSRGEVFMRLARKGSIYMLALALTVFLCGVANGDWNPGDPAKWVQTPDLNPTGMDVNASFAGQVPFMKILADDWRCTSMDPVSDIHIWGSWLNDRLPPGGPCSVR